MNLQKEESSSTIISNFQPDCCEEGMTKNSCYVDFGRSASQVMLGNSPMPSQTVFSQSPNCSSEMFVRYIPNMGSSTSVIHIDPHFHLNNGVMQRVQLQNMASWSSSPVDGTPYTSNRMVHRVSSASALPLTYRPSDSMLSTAESTYSDPGNVQLQRQMSELSSRLSSFMNVIEKSTDSPNIPSSYSENEHDDSDDDLMSRELRKTQLELANTASKLVEIKQTRRNELKHLREQLHSQRQKSDEWKTKSKQSEKCFQDVTRELEAVKHYLTCVPSLEESNELKKKFQQSEDMRMKLQRTMLDLEEKLKNKEDDVGDLRRDIQTLKEALLKQRSSAVNSPDVTFKKLLKAKQDVVDEQEARHKKEIAALQSKLAEEETAQLECGTNLRKTNEELRRLQSSFRELSVQNQNLLAKNMELRNNLKKRSEEENLSEDVVLKGGGGLLRQLDTCIYEIRTLVTAGTQLIAGQDPNVSCLLGTTESAALAFPNKDGGYDLGTWTTQVKEMRKEVQKLRQQVADSYAESLGNNINCKVQ